MSTLLHFFSYQSWQELITKLWANGWVQFCCWFLIAAIIAIVASRITRPLENKLPLQLAKIIRKFIIFLIWLFALIQALHAVGVDLISILGAAGVAGVAIGFAAQTTLSNLISGIFIMSERSIRLGDYIRTNNVEGTVESVNLLSITLRQTDNSCVRVPCESIIKTPVVNVTGDSLRRCDFDLGVDYDSDIEHVRQVILSIVDRHPLLISDPAPVILFSGFGDSSINLHIGAWCKTEHYHNVRFELARDILAAFKQEGISIPFPTRHVISN